MDAIAEHRLLCWVGRSARSGAGRGRRDSKRAAIGIRKSLRLGSELISFWSDHQGFVLQAIPRIENRNANWQFAMKNPRRPSECSDVHQDLPAAGAAGDRVGRGRRPRAGHEVRLIDLQVESTANFSGWSRSGGRTSIAISCNYLANVPEVIDLAEGDARRSCPRPSSSSAGTAPRSSPRDRSIMPTARSIACSRAKARPPRASASKRCSATPGLCSRCPEWSPGRPGAAAGFAQEPRGPASRPATCSPSPQVFHRRARPLRSIEFSRGCPWDCSFCSAWTFYGRSYRIKAAEAAVDELATIREPGVFIVDDVAFIQAEHGMAIGEAIARAGIRKQYYLETRGDVLLRNKEVFRFWKKLGSSTCSWESRRSTRRG